MTPPLTRFAILLALSVAASPAFANECPPATPVSVKVTFEHIQTPVEKNVTSRQLTDEMRTADIQAGGDSNIFATEAHWMVGGLNRSNIKTSYQMPYLRRDNASAGTSCFMPQEFNYNITYENTIFIAEDFKLMGCRYSATMAHEKRHEKTDLKLLEEYAADAQKTLEAAVAGLRPIGPVPTGDLEAEYTKVMESLTEKLRPAYTRMLQIRRQKQADIDSYENYMRDTALCPEQFPRFDEEAGE